MRNCLFLPPQAPQLFLLRGREAAFAKTFVAFRPGHPVANRLGGGLKPLPGSSGVRSPIGCTILTAETQGGYGERDFGMWTSSFHPSIRMFTKPGNFNE